MAQKNPDRTISVDRRVTDEMRLANLGLASTQYYNAQVPSMGNTARLAVSATVRFPGLAAISHLPDVFFDCALPVAIDAYGTPRSPFRRRRGLRINLYSHSIRIERCKDQLRHY